MSEQTHSLLAPLRTIAYWAATYIYGREGDFSRHTSTMYVRGIVASAYAICDELRETWSKVGTFWCDGVPNFPTVIEACFT